MAIVGDGMLAQAAAAAAAAAAAGGCHTAARTSQNSCHDAPGGPAAMSMSACDTRVLRVCVTSRDREHSAGAQRS
jgi:hypothetical protein